MLEAHRGTAPWVRRGMCGKRVGVVGRGLICGGSEREIGRCWVERAVSIGGGASLLVFIEERAINPIGLHEFVRNVLVQFNSIASIVIPS